MLIQSNLGHVLGRHTYGSPLSGSFIHRCYEQPRHDWMEAPPRAVSRCRNRVSSTPATILDIHAERRSRDRRSLYLG
jgi:hypothetical protein